MFRFEFIKARLLTNDAPFGIQLFVHAKSGIDVAKIVLDVPN